jgi:cytochrome bd-type quinol oxidase subunit 1
MNPNFSDPAFWSRFQFGFTLVYHYLFPQLTMGLAWFLLYWKWRRCGRATKISPRRSRRSNSGGSV